MSDEKVTFNAGNNRYEMHVGDEIVFADVNREDGVLFIKYVEAPVALRGTGAAGRFMQGLMDIVRHEKLKVVPICGYAAGWIRRHAEYDDLVA